MEDDEVESYMNSQGMTASEKEKETIEASIHYYWEDMIKVLEDNKEELFSEADIKEIYNGIYEYILKKEYYEDNIVNAFLSGVQVKKSCGGYGNILSIKPDGKLSLCCNIDDVSCEIGDIRKNSIEQIKNSIEKKIIIMK